MATKIFEGFSISHAAILDGDTGAEEVNGDIYGVRSGSLSADVGNYDNTGDDFVLSSWFWLNFGSIAVEAGYIPFELIALLSGTSVTTSGSAPNDYYDVPLWNENSINQPVRPMLLRVPSRDSAGVNRVLDIVLYKVQFSIPNFTGPSYKSGLLLNYTGRALISSVNEKNEALSERAFGRLINKPS